jgi:hypothetical protein
MVFMMALAVDMRRFPQRKMAVSTGTGSFYFPLSCAWQGMSGFQKKPLRGRLRPLALAAPMKFS